MGVWVLGDGLTGILDGLLREGLKGRRLIALCVDKLVVHDLDIAVIGREQRDLIRDCLGVRKGRHVLAHAREAEHYMRAAGPAQLGLRLLPQHHDIRFRFLLQHPSRSLGQAGVNTSAEALIRAGDHDEGFLVFALDGLGLGLVEDGVGCLAVGAGFGHVALGPGEFGGGDDFHSFGDFFDVADGFEAAFDFAEGGIGGAVGHHRPRKYKISFDFSSICELLSPLKAPRSDVKPLFRAG